MENCKKFKSEILLLKVVIQHIQSFMNGKEAAQTCLLSKSWYSARLTRPNLDFHQLDFNYKLAFWDFATKTTQRYESLNRKIGSLRLRVYGKGSEEHSDVAANLILKAMKLGATDITFEHDWDNDTEIYFGRMWYYKVLTSMLEEWVAKSSQHEICVSLNMGGSYEEMFDYPKGVQGLPTVRVLEDLVFRCLDPSWGSSASEDGSFWSCRPKFITLELTTKHECLETLFMTLIQRVSGNSCIPNRNNLDLHDLEESLQLKTLLYASVRRESISKIASN